MPKLPSKSIKSRKGPTQEPYSKATTTNASKTTFWSTKTCKIKGKCSNKNLWPYVQIFLFRSKKHDLWKYQSHLMIYCLNSLNSILIPSIYSYFQFLFLEDIFDWIAFHFGYWKIWLKLLNFNMLILFNPNNLIFNKTTLKKIRLFLDLYAIRIKLACANLALLNPLFGR